MMVETIRVHTDSTLQQAKKVHAQACAYSPAALRWLAVLAAASCQARCL